VVKPWASAHRLVKSTRLALLPSAFPASGKKFSAYFLLRLATASGESGSNRSLHGFAIFTFRAGNLPEQLPKSINTDQLE
jgi:hypothetical protein